MSKLKAVPFLFIFFCLLCFYSTFGQVTCSTYVAPTFTRPHPCFNDYFTSITATGDMGTTSSISITSGCTDPAYTDLFATQGIDAPVGANVTLSVSRFTTHYTAYLSVYIDWDNDSVFEAHEYAGLATGAANDVQLGPAEMTVSSYRIDPPCGAPAGHFRMRVMLSEALLGLNAPCSATYGQAYDFYYNSYCPSHTLVGDTFICRFDTATLRASYGCGEWSSSSAFVTVDSNGFISSNATTGTTTIAYTSDACGVSSAVVTIGVMPFTVLSPLCVGGTATVNTWPAGGTWNIASSYVASIATDTSQCVVTGEHAGTTLLSYSMAGCTYTASAPILSSVSISGDAIVCLGHAKTLSVVPPDGTWSSSNTAIATVGSATGVVSGLTAGTVTISYQAPYGACWGYKTMTVQAVTITGSLGVCAGATTTLTAAPSGGTWSLDPAAEGMTLSSGGVFSGLHAAAASPTGFVVTYTSPAGCQAEDYIYVEDLRIYLPAAVCIGYSVQVFIGGPGLHGSYVAGVPLSSSNAAVATVNPATGYVTGVSTGTAVITYTSSSGCIATTNVVVSSTPVLPSVNLCIGNTLDFSMDGPGTWSSSNIAKATVHSTDGMVTGVATGTAYITFTPGGGGSGCPVVHEVAVLSPPSITGSTEVCQGLAITLSASPSGGTWSCSNSQASVSAGVVNGLAAGTPTIFYTGANGCIASHPITVHGIPTITGASSVCTTTNLTPSILGGTWSSNNTGLATINSSGTISSVAHGNVIISYISLYGCVGTYSILSLRPTFGTDVVDNYCVAGIGYSAFATPGGGTWSSSNASIFNISSTGGVSIGDAGGSSVVITYTSGGCSRSKTVTIHDRPKLTTASGLPIPLIYLSVGGDSYRELSLTPHQPMPSPWSPLYYGAGLTGSPPVYTIMHLPSDSQMTVKPSIGNYGTGSVYYFVYMEGYECRSKKISIVVGI